MHYRADVNNPRGAGVTWFHEHGHLIDGMLGNVSNDECFEKLLRKDVLQYRLDYGKNII